MVCAPENKGVLLIVDIMTKHSCQEPREQDYCALAVLCPAGEPTKGQRHRTDTEGRHKAKTNKNKNHKQNRVTQDKKSQSTRGDTIDLA